MIIDSQKTDKVTIDPQGKLRSPSCTVEVDRMSGRPMVTLRIADLDTEDDKERLLKEIFGGEQVHLTPDEAEWVANELQTWAHSCRMVPDMRETCYQRPVYDIHEDYSI